MDVLQTITWDELLTIYIAAEWKPDILPIIRDQANQLALIGAHPSLLHAPTKRAYDQGSSHGHVIPSLGDIIAQIIMDRLAYLAKERTKALDHWREIVGNRDGVLLEVEVRMADDPRGTVVETFELAGNAIDDDLPF